MYNNPYMPTYNNAYNQQSINDRIDNQIAQLQQMKEQMRNQSGGITQNFQLAPSNNGKMRYAGTIDDVNKENVTEETPFFSKDMSVLWVKNPSGNIKIYELKETPLKDSKDMLIDALMLQIEDLKKEVKNAKPINTNDDESDKTEKSSNVSSRKSSKTE